MPHEGEEDGGCRSLDDAQRMGCRLFFFFTYRHEGEEGGGRWRTVDDGGGWTQELKVTKVDDGGGWRMECGWDQSEGCIMREEGQGVVKNVEVGEARRQRVGPHVSVDLNQNIEYIPEQSQWTGYRDPTPPSPPPSVDEYSPGQTQSVPSVPSGGTSSSRGSKRKAPMVDSIDTQFDKLTTSLDGFANVLSSSNVHFGVISDAAMRQVSAMEDKNEILRSQTEILRRTPNYTYTEADIYEMLTAMNISDENLLE
ncbi:uncharacterized protein HKW66_Vig0205180 [Vigna angularis]|uniref:Uncharacterized protein n=1 Tax=Phaseolus angularis TaxID=3914 RepID=A0A8T0JL41_PHAAN|nr:uncharacterized protein HKW66_Vig0205180 [Vigna angularis]